MHCTYYSKDMKTHNITAFAFPYSMNEPQLPTHKKSPIVEPFASFSPT